jgi:ABC-type transport system substrate-binding protein
VDGIRLAIIPDTSQQLAQFTAGNLDELTLDSPFSLDAATKSNPKAVLVKAVDGQPSPVFWQMGDPTSVFQDIRVRRALNMAIDRDTIAKVIFNGEAVAPVFIPASMGKWSLLIKDLPATIQQYYNYNPDEAKKMLDAAGVSGQQFRLVYPNTFGTPSYVKHCETIGSMLNAVGIKTNIEVIDYNKDYIDSGKGISQGYYPKDMLVFGGFSVYTEADEWIYSYLDSKSVNSHINIKDPALDAMIDKERATLNEADRVKAVQAIQTYVAENALYLPTVGGYYNLLIQPRVQNYQFTAEAGKATETYGKLWLSA